MRKGPKAIVLFAMGPNKLQDTRSTGDAISARSICAAQSAVRNFTPEAFTITTVYIGRMVSCFEASSLTFFVLVFLYDSSKYVNVYV
eukprot:843129-Prorocentrum_minimum.AAC.1